LRETVKDGKRVSQAGYGTLIGACNALRGSVKARALLSSLLLTTWTVAYPLKLLADKTDRRYDHAAERFCEGDLEGAAKELKRIVASRPGYTRASILLGAANFLLGRQAEGAGGSSALAIAGLREALRLDPSEAYWRSALAGLLNRQGDAEGAARECALASQLSPDDSRLATGCGLRGQLLEDGLDLADARPRDQSVKPPFCVFHPEPPYSKQARMVKLQGVTVLRIVVNAQGLVEQAYVEKALGLGLDQSALRTVRTWKFQPGTKNGEPAPVRVRVEVFFRLF
jgi:TonB family protein